MEESYVAQFLKIRNFRWESTPSSWSSGKYYSCSVYERKIRDNYHQTSRKRPPRMRRFRDRLREVVVFLAAAFRVVTQCSSPLRDGALMTTLKTAAKETRGWSLKRFERQGFSSENSSRHIYFSVDNLSNL